MVSPTQEPGPCHYANRQCYHQAGVIGGITHPGCVAKLVTGSQTRPGGDYVDRRLSRQAVIIRVSTFITSVVTESGIRHHDDHQLMCPAGVVTTAIAGGVAEPGSVTASIASGFTKPRLRCRGALSPS